MIRTTQQVVDLQPGLPLTLDCTGEGPALLLLHGGAGPSSVTSIIEHYAGRYQVLTPTHPGYGGTPHSAHLSNVAALARTYLELLTQLDLSDVTVIGSSFGGWVAAEMAIHQTGHQLGGVVLLNAAGPQLQPRHAPDPATAPTAPTRAGQAPSPTELGWMHAYTGPTMQDPNLLTRLAAADVPALVIWGEDDPILPVQFGRDYADAFPHGHFDLIPGAGHLPFLDQPDNTFTSIDKHLLHAAQVLVPTLDASTA